MDIFNGDENVDENLHRVSEAVRKDKEGTGKIWDLFTVKSNRKAAIIVFGLRAFQQFSGVAAIMFYAKIIFQEASTDISANLSTIIYFIIQLVMSLLSSFIVDKTGRRPLLIFSIIGSAVALATEGLYFYFENDELYSTSSLIYLPLIALLTFVVIFNLGMGTIPVLILGEFFPTNVKAFALCIADMVSCTTVSISAKFFQITKDNFGMHVPFFSFTVCCLLALVFILLYIPETKGKTLEEIQEHLRGDHKKESETVTRFIKILLIKVIVVNFNIKQTALISGIIPILHFVTFYFMPESPYYLKISSIKEETRDSMDIFNGDENVDENLHRVSEAVRKDKEGTGKIWDLFTVKSSRKAAIIVFGLRAFQQFSGVAAIMFYAKIIFQEASTDISANLSTIIYFIIQLVMSLLSSFIVDKTGRRPLLIFSIIGSAVALATEGLYFYFENDELYSTSSLIYLPLIALLTFVVIFNLGMGTIPVLILGEFFPTNVKAFALCIADMVSCTTVSISAKFFQITKDNFGMHVPFFSFTVCCLLALVFILLYIPETKGKTLEEIQEHLRGDHKKESETVTRSVDKSGRRPLLIFSIIGSAVALATEGLYFYFENDELYSTSLLIYLPLIALLTFVVIFNLGMGTIPVLILGEFFPTNVKASV
ncbi:unnamed protein product [Brassicogethes aeneus]|uniref:Major facilitator superfamily (MFS) profile domain-containing protein n=1 Tax=Brassicogethes aeneus TaxID=1431903 RepID=A0A9P0AN74_BRAAE|nr:unnamed protein product [Brassicogethes aeneus]